MGLALDDDDPAAAGFRATFDRATSAMDRGHKLLTADAAAKVRQGCWTEYGRQPLRGQKRDAVSCAIDASMARWKAQHEALP